MKEGKEEKKSKKEQISCVKVEKTNVGNTVFINIKAIQGIEDCIIEDSVPLKNVDVEVDGAEKIEKDGKTLIRWHVDRMEKGSEINLGYKVYKKTKGGIRYGVGLTKEKLPPAEVTWKEKGEVEEAPEALVEERKTKEEEGIKEKEEVKEKPKREITEKEPERLNIEDITPPMIKEILHEENIEEPKEREGRKKMEEKKQAPKKLKEKAVKDGEKKLEELKTPEADKLINKTVLIACVIGIGVTIALIYYIEQEEPYPDLYIYPGSYSKYVEGDKVSFTYGVRSFETEKTRYELQVFLGEKLVKEKEFSLEKGEKLEETISIDVPYNIEFPVKVRIMVRMNNKENSVHFWLNGRK